MEAKLVQFKANEKILSDKDFTTLGEKVQNLCLNDDLLENLHQRSKEIEKDACDLVCNYNSLSNHVWTNDCLIIRQIDNDFFLFTEEASKTVFIQKKSTLKASTMDTWKPSKESRKMKTSKNMRSKMKMMKFSLSVIY